MAHNKPGAQTRQSALYPDAMPNPEGRADEKVTLTYQQKGLINLRTSADTGRLMRRYFGTELPATANSFTRSGERRAVWLGPDEFLLICSDAETEELNRTISTQMAGQHFALTVISDALSVYQVSGGRVRDLLAKGCGLDLHKSVFRPDMCAQSTLDRAAVTFICETEDSFRLICRRSFADYVESWLKDAATEYGYEMR